eukprot:TRINITY_DN41389_c0_g1_i1.p1 TRINITY_DN41389_c0_g1~~TRINITY_DN41389_c0_g1_i1.p1  ORF type:complete len:165 (-),score=13.51 TRINITY_DN41389_c0_g1_i1:10-504(-)
MKVMPLLEFRILFFSWEVQHTDRAQKQTAYQLLVYLRTNNRLVWDSRQVNSTQPFGISYNSSTSLVSDTSYKWQVRWWDSNGIASNYSAFTSFDVGLLDTQSWGGSAWIGLPYTWLGGPPNYSQIRREFTLDTTPTRARCYISGEIGRAVQQECRDRSRMPSSA